MKPIVFKGLLLSDIRHFSIDVRREVGFQLDKVQQGFTPSDWKPKPMPSIGSGVREIRVRERTGAYRVIYVATFEDAIYILTAFQKKQQKTPQQEIDKAKRYFKELQQ